MRTKIAIFASGEGSNFEALVLASRAGELEAEIVGLLTNRAGTPALARAERLGVPTATLKGKDYPTYAAWDEAVALQLRSWKTEFVALAGFLARIGPKTLSTCPQRIVNSHPSLLPKYGGKGLYGNRVHEAVLAAGETETGITIHLIDEVYDRGQILAQMRVPVFKGDTPESLSSRVKASENLFYAKTLNQLILAGFTTR